MKMLGNKFALAIAVELLATGAAVYID